VINARYQALFDGVGLKGSNKK